MKKNQKQAFTLIELLVVVAIISLLSSVVMVSLSSARTKSRDTKRIETLIQMRTALTMYLFDNGGIPACESIEGVCYDTSLNNLLSQPLTLSGLDKNSRSRWWSFSIVKIANASTLYITSLPVDPLNLGGYKYFYATGPVSNWSHVDKNNNTVVLANQGIFFAISESKTVNISNPYTIGVTIGEPDSVDGYGAVVSEVIGSSDSSSGSGSFSGGM